jgi:hypothetical protein
MRSPAGRKAESTTILPRVAGTRRCSTVCSETATAIRCTRIRTDASPNDVGASEHRSCNRPVHRTAFACAVRHPQREVRRAYDLATIYAGFDVALFSGALRGAQWRVDRHRLTGWTRARWCPSLPAYRRSATQLVVINNGQGVASRIKARREINMHNNHIRAFPPWRRLSARRGRRYRSAVSLQACHEEVAVLCRWVPHRHRARCHRPRRLSKPLAQDGWIRENAVRATAAFTELARRRGS